MAKKTVVRRLFKMLPASVELSKALEAEDNQTTSILDADYVVPEFKPDVQKLTNALDQDRAAQIAEERALYERSFLTLIDAGKKAPEVCGLEPKVWAQTASREQLALALSLFE